MGRELTQEQQIAASTLDRAVALTAAAGSGKTTVLVERYLQSLREGLAPREILVVTFTTDAARQLRERIRAKATDYQEEIENSPYIGTLHGFCYRLLDQYGSVIGLETVHSIVTPFEWAEIFERHFQTWLGGLPETPLRELLGSLTLGDLRNLARLWYRNRAELANEMEAPPWFATLKEAVPSLFAELDRELRKAGRYSFDDLEELALEILNVSPATAETYALQFRSICVDEFQDTSDRQWQILQKLLGNNPQKLFVVGDPKQSIYRFRGANLKVFRQASEEIERRGGALLALNDNFRSHPGLLEQINRVSDRLFQSSLVPFSPMRAGRSDSPTQVTRFRIIRFEQEISSAVTHVKELLDAGSTPGKIALLFRVADRIGDYFDALRDSGIPVSARRTTRLFELYDVLDLFHYFQALITPSHPFPLAAFLRSPYVNLPETALYELIGRSPGNLLEALQEKQKEKLGWFLDLMKSENRSVQNALQKLFQYTGTFPSRPEIFLETLTPLLEKTDDLEEALRLMEIWQAEGIVLSTLSHSGAADSIRLLTIHGAKGLEFDHVCLVDNLRLPARSYPLLRIQPGRPVGFRYRQGGEFVENEAYKVLAEEEKLAELEESQRLLYVAMTRAKETLSVFLPEDRDSIPKQSWGAIWEEEAKR